MSDNINTLKGLLDEINLSGNKGLDGDFIEKADGKEDIDSESLEEQKALRKAQTHRYTSNTKDRKWLAIWSAIVVSFWLAFVLVILINNDSCIHLSDSVLDVLLGTTTLNVLGLTFIVLKGHFNSKE